MVFTDCIVSGLSRFVHLVVVFVFVFFAPVFVQFHAPIYCCIPIPCLPTLVFLSEMLLNFVFFGILVRRSYQTGVFFTLCHIGYLFRF